MNRSRTIAAAVLVAAMIAAPAAAAKTARSVVSEAVVSKLSPNGTPMSSIVEQLIRLNGTAAAPTSVSVPNALDLQSYRNLSGFRGASGEGGGLVWRSSGKRDVMTLAKAAKKLPVAVSIKYFLDGKEITAQQLKGRSGVVRIDVEIDNVSGNAKTLTYKGVSSPYLTSVTTQYVPVEYMVRVDFPTETWSNVGGQDVSVLPGNNVQVASASGFLSPPVTDTSRTVSFEARSSDALTPKIQVFATPQVSSQLIDSLQSQYEALKALYGGSGAISDNLKKVYDGTLALADGVQKMLGGVGTNDPTTHKPVITLDANGTPTTLLGAIGEIGDGVSDKILPGLGDVNPATGDGVMCHGGGVTARGNCLNTDSGKEDPATLIGGLAGEKIAFDGRFGLIKAMTDAVAQVKDSKTQIAAGADQFKSAVSGGGSQLVGGLGQLEDGVGQVIDGLDGDFKSGLQGLLTGLGDKNNPPVLLDTGTGLPCAVPSATCQPADVISALTVMNGAMGQLITALGNKNNPPVLVDTGTGLPCAVPSATCQPADVISALTVSKGALDAISTGLSGIITSLSGIKTTLTSLASTASADSATAASDAAVCAGDATCAALGTIAADLGTFATHFGTIAGTLSAVVAGLGDTSTPGATVLFSLASINTGVTTLSSGITTLIGKLQTNSAATPGFREGLSAVGSGLTALIGKLQTNSLATPGFREGLQLLLAGLGSASDPPTTSTVIGGLLLVKGGLVTAGSGAGDLVSGVLDGINKFAGGVITGLDGVQVGFSNPDFTKPQPGLGGRVPKDYYKECPACFDPDHPKFDKRTDNPKFHPGLKEVFELFSEGITDSLPKLDSNDKRNPGLVDGLEQVAAGLSEIAKNLQTFDPKNPGLVDGLQLIRGGLQQAGQGVFAINELGLNTLHGQVGDQGDGVSQASTSLTDAANTAARSSVLGASADSVSTTYVFVLDAQSTARRDNTVRWAITGAVLALLGGFAWRPRLLPL